MNEDLTNNELFDALNASEVEEGCHCLLTAGYFGGKEDRANALEFVAGLKRFRPEFLRRRGIEQNLPVVIQAARHRDARTLRPDVVKAWLIARHQLLLSAFLTAAGIPQEDGFVKGEPMAPTREALRRAIDEVSARFDHRVVAIYLGYQIINGGDFWENLPAAVTPEEMAFVGSGPSSEGVPSMEPLGT